MPTVTRVIEIDASADVVWALLTDISAYPAWNPFMTRVDGRLEVGDRLTVTIQPPGGRSQTFRPAVTALEPGHRIEWLGRLLAPGIFDGRHHLTVDALSPTTSRFTQSEDFNGFLVPLFGRLLERTDAGFAAMNNALARLSEQRDRLPLTS